MSVLLDTFGTEELNREFLAPLHECGAAIALFNPQRWLRRSFRNHRKLLACDGQHAIVGGFNIAPEYAGDGLTPRLVRHRRVRQWPGGADCSRPASTRCGIWRRSRRARCAASASRAARDRRAPRERDAPVHLLLAGPCNASADSCDTALGADLEACARHGHRLGVFSARRAAFAGCSTVLRATGAINCCSPAHSDVPLARLAAERLYGRLLARGVRIFEYQPQVLHAKLVLVDEVAYVGSANLDRRSLHINYELLLRLDWPELVQDARHWFARTLQAAAPLDRAGWKARRGLLRRLVSWLAYWLLARLDPLVARQGFRNIS